MMIWITAYCLLSLIPFIKGKYSWEHYIWVLLPIQFFGFSIGGVTIKPYMLFTIIIILTELNNISLDHKTIIGLVCYAGFQIIIDLLNDSDKQSYFIQGLVIIVFLCALVYCSIIWQKQDGINEMFEAIIDAGFAYCIICSMAVLFHYANYRVPYLYASSRNSSGLFVYYSNMMDGELKSTYRLRGFTGDPNLLSISMIIPCVIAYYMRLKDIRNKTRINNVKFFLHIILSLLCIVYSDSRTGIISFLIGFIMVYMFLGDKKNRKKFMVLLIGGISFLVIMKYGFVDIILNHERSSFFSSTGRVSIWKDALDILFSNNFFVGIGTARMASNDYLGVYCHNTWLEWICSDGIILGNLITLFFCLFGFFQLGKSTTDRDRIITMIICYYCCFISLISVDDLANAHLIYTMCLLATCNNDTMTNYVQTTRKNKYECSARKSKYIIR